MTARLVSLNRARRGAYNDVDVVNSSGVAVGLKMNVKFSFSRRTGSCSSDFCNLFLFLCVSVCAIEEKLVIYGVVDARNYVAPGADRPPAAARALAEYIVRLLPP